MADSITGFVSSSVLEDNIGKTIIGDYLLKIDDLYNNMVKNKDSNNIAIPMLEFLADEIPELGSRLVSLYNGTLGNINGVQHIPDSIKIAQGALLDGLCFGYDLVNSTYALYTMNFKLLQDIKLSDDEIAIQCIKKNLVGELKCYRVDITYNNSPESFSFKFVNHRKKIDEENVVLVPYSAVKRIMALMESTLRSGYTFKVRQDVAGTSKVRFITLDTKILSDYCDSPVSKDSLSLAFFPLKGFFYAPVVGAPSTTSMVTNVNIFDMYELRFAKEGDIKQYGLEKPEGSVERMLTDGLIVSSIMELIAEDINQSYFMLLEFPRISSILNNVENVEMITPSTIQSYLHSLSNDEYEKVVFSIPGLRKKVADRKGIFSGMRSATEEERKNLSKTLSKNICKIIIRKADCKLSSITCTNSVSTLQSLYGNSYFGIYEGVRVRFNRLYFDLINGKDIQDSFDFCGFVLTEELKEDIANLMVNTYNALCSLYSNYYSETLDLYEDSSNNYLSTVKMKNFIQYVLDKALSLGEISKSQYVKVPEDLSKQFFKGTDIGEYLGKTINTSGNLTSVLSGVSKLYSSYLVGIRDILKVEIYGDSDSSKAEKYYNSSNIMVRTCYAYIANGKIEDYYRYVDPSRVVSIDILG